MAVHVPLSIEAQLEARVLMMSTNNILNPSNGKPIINPSKDIVLGIYYLTMELPGETGENMLFGDVAEIHHGLFQKSLTLHAKIKFRKIFKDEDGTERSTIFETTPGRIILADLLPDNSKFVFDFVNKVLTSKELSKLIDVIFRTYGQKKTVIFTDKIMKLGFSYASKSSISFGKEDMLIPESKQKHIDDAFEKIKEYEKQHSDGFITIGEKYNKVIDTWSRCTDSVADDMMKGIASGHQNDDSKKSQEKVNSIYMMAHSGARGSAAQIRQLAGMRGLMAKPSGEIIETPIISNLKEGLNVLEYFNSTHGARKGQADTALKTASSGYLTRRLVDVAMDCIVTEYDCGTTKGLEVNAIVDGGEVTLPLSERVLGRTASNDVFHPVSGELIIKNAGLIDEQVVAMLDMAGIDIIKVRSVLTCETKEGVCAKCYGRDLATGDLVSMGEAVGVVAAQSIGEPGTQLTLRTFHIGGAATKGAEISNIESSYDGTIKLINDNIVIDSKSNKILMSRSCEVLVLDIKKNEKARYRVPYGAVLLVNEGMNVKKGQVLAEWDPFTIPIITEKTGKIDFKDLVESVSIKEIVDEATGISSKVIIDWKQKTRGADLRPRINLVDSNGELLKLANSLDARYFLPIDAVLNVQNGSEVHAGDIIARIPKESSKTSDITGGLPRVAELFEARKPKDHSIISETNGYVEFGKDYKSKRRLVINSRETGVDPIEYMIPKGKHITVNEGDFVKRGDLLMDGNPVLQDILKILGVEALSRYMVDEVQQVYRLQGVKIDDKHIEVIVSRMLSKVEIVDPGETVLIAGEQVDKEELEEINLKAQNEGFKGATATPIIQGITKASLQTRSFISAASFQETTRVLTESSVAGKVDKLKGIKENVIVGRLIPAGTGFYVNSVKAKIKQQMQDEDDLMAV